MKAHRNRRDSADPCKGTGSGARAHRPAALGMLMGIVAGSGAATIFFAISGNALWFMLIGFSTVIGLLAGARAEMRRGPNRYR